MDPPSNTPEFTVAELSSAVKRTLEEGFGRVRVRGEVTEVKQYGPTRFYFSLKDPGGKLRSVIWAWSAARSGLKPENGVEVIATGRLTSYAEQSTYQLTVERLDYAGEGALLARIEALRKKLAEEGLFDAARKRALPVLPQVIGVITSAQGAVLQDIRTTIARRFPREILLWPVPVQGEGAAERIAAAIAGFNAIATGGAVPRPDVLIVARGGGSLEDLMAFNEESVVRAAAASRIPLISAVGHETDTTLIDFAADHRAPTPTAAAEMAVPSRADLLADLAQRSARLLAAAKAWLNAAHLALSRAERGLPDLPALLANARQRLDDRAERLAAAPGALLRRRRDALATLAARLPHPREAIAARRARIELLGTRGRSAATRSLDAARGRLDRAPLAAPRLDARRAQLDGLAARLESASYLAVLARGFALVRDAAGPVTRADAVKPGARLNLLFADGEARVTADRAPPAQGSLL
jgi:exodeoxyribonuclease VII large subunit